MIDKRIRIGLALALFFIGLSNVSHAFNLMDNGNSTILSFGQLSLFSYVLMMVAAILIFMKKKTGLFLAYGAILITAFGLTHTGFYNGYGFGDSFAKSLGMLESRDYLWIAFNFGLMLFIGFAHKSWKIIEPQGKNCEQESSV